MKLIQSWNPLEELTHVQNHLLRAMNLPSLHSPQQANSDRAGGPHWTPNVDISEDGDGYDIKAELPSVDRENVHVDLENGVLSITGERHFRKEENGLKYHRVERSYGKFVRTFTIPEDADESQVTADFRDGVLNIHIPKSEAKKPKKIEVKVN